MGATISASRLSVLLKGGLRRAPAPAQPERAPGQARKMAMPGEPLNSTLGALGAATCGLLVHTLPTKVGADFASLLGLLDWRHRPKPGSTRQPVVLVLDNRPVHTSKASTATLAARPWTTAGWLPALRA